MATTQTSDLLTDTVAYNKVLRYGLHKRNYFDQVATVQSFPQTHPGSSVKWNFTTVTGSQDIEQTSTLTETTDVTPVTLADSMVTVTISEYGAAAKVTAYLMAVSYLDELLRALTWVGKSAGATLDRVARNTLVAGTNVLYSGTATARNDVATSENLTGANVRQATAFLRKKFADTFTMDDYMAFIHPDVSYDLRGSTATNNWYDVAQRNEGGGRIWRGAIGKFENNIFIETPSVGIFTDAGNGAGATGTIDVYPTLFVGKEALGKAWSENGQNGPQPRVVESPVIDNLRRFQGYGWHWIGGYALVRDVEELVRYESASTIGTNA